MFPELTLENMQTYKRVKGDITQIQEYIFDKGINYMEKAYNTYVDENKQDYNIYRKINTKIKDYKDNVFPMYLLFFLFAITWGLVITLPNPNKFAQEWRLIGLMWIPLGIYCLRATVYYCKFKKLSKRL